jgi:hypothetical protein
MPGGDGPDDAVVNTYVPRHTLFTQVSLLESRVHKTQYC